MDERWMQRALWIERALEQAEQDIEQARAMDIAPTPGELLRRDWEDEEE